MKVPLPENYQGAVAEAEANFLAGTEGTVVSDPRVQIYSTPKGGISVKIHGQTSKWLYWAFIRFLKNREGLQQSWKNGLGVISYTLKKAEE